MSSSLTYELFTITHLGLQRYGDSLVIFFVIDLHFISLLSEHVL